MSIKHTPDQGDERRAFEAARDALHACFEQREGAMRLVGRAVRLLPDLERILSAAQPVAQEAREQGWRAAIDVHSRHGMAGWSSHKDAALSAPQEATEGDTKREREMAMMIRRIVSKARRHCDDDSPVLKLINEAWELLCKMGMQGSPLRDDSAPQEAGKPCEHCDDTGDVHGYDGEWRGYCECHAGVRLHRDALLKTITTHPSQQAVSDAQRRVLDFLYGVGELEGCGFSEKPTGELGNFWWRKHLRSAFPDILAAAGGGEK